MHVHRHLVAVGAAALLAAYATASPAADVDLVTDAKTGNIAAVRQSLETKRGVDAAEADGTTALMWAVRNGDQPLVTLLLKAGSNANAVNRYGATPLSLAAAAGNAAALDALLKADASPATAEARLPDGQTLL